MSDFTGNFWSAYVAAATLLSILACMLLLWARTAPNRGLNSVLKVRLRVSVGVKYLLIMRGSSSFCVVILGKIDLSGVRRRPALLPLRFCNTMRDCSARSPVTKVSENAAQKL